MKHILIIGGGGREHALAWKARQSEGVSCVFVAPGNAGTALEPGIENVPIDAHDIDSLCHFAKTQAIDLTIVGPEDPLAAGIVDRFQREQLACFGPNKEAAQLESSKVFCKRFLTKNHIPTAPYQVFTKSAPALAHVQNLKTFPIVIKKAGLAAGKGVFVVHDLAEAQKVLNTLFDEKLPATIIIESFLSGTEVSFIVLTDGTTALPLAVAQDHKTRDNDDKGPNTGGMGAYSCDSMITPAMQDKIMQQIIYPTLDVMARQYCPYVGFLYAGLMIDAQQNPYLLEYNCRLGDPEAQTILMRMQSDLVQVCTQASQGKLSQVALKWDKNPTLGVVLANQGYPLDYATGQVLARPQVLPKDCKIFHAGTKLQDQKIIATGGRVLCVTKKAPTLYAAYRDVYALIPQVAWQNAHYRTDIGLKHLQQSGEDQPKS